MFNMSNDLQIYLSYLYATSLNSAKEKLSNENNYDENGHIKDGVLSNDEIEALKWFNPNNYGKGR